MNREYQNNPIWNAIATGINHLKRLSEWWSFKLRTDWNAGDMGNRLVAIALFVAGLAGILVLACAMLYLLPLVLLAVFVSAIWPAVLTNTHGHQ